MSLSLAPAETGVATFLPGKERVADMTKFKAEKSPSWFQHTIGLLKCLRQSRYDEFVSAEQHLSAVVPNDNSVMN